MPSARRLLAAGLVVAGAAVIGATPARAQVGFERITDYRVAIEIQSNGDLVIVEAIDYHFGSQQRHGILREIPVRYRFDDRYDRVYGFDVLSVSASPGTPAQYELEDAGGGRQRIRIGDPDRTISGPHRYTISYRIRGALNGFADHDELYWNAIGAEWDVAIEQAHAVVVAPADITQVACFSGPIGSTLPCGTTNHDGDTARFDHDFLSPRQALTVVVAIPTGVVPRPRPILDERWSFQRAFEVRSTTVAASGGLLALVVAGFAVLAWKRGRDRQWAGSPVDVAFGAPDGAAERPVPLGGHAETPVEFAPPDELRPGQVGTLVDEVAHPLDVTATIVDLAVRGYLRIEEIPKEGWFGKKDWRLVRLQGPGDLLAYEQMLYDSLFKGHDGAVNLSELKNTFASELSDVRNALYDEVVRQGWFRKRPDHTRTAWVGLGVLLFLAGGGLVALAAVFTRWALVPIPLVIGGVLLMAGAGAMPRRTSKGTATLRRVNGFRRFIDESERDRARFAEQQHLFSEYLPYAVVFGATEKWAKAFAGLDGELPQAGTWYVGHHPFTAMHFSEAMDGFTTTTTGTLTSTPASSGSSGFGGGGSSGGGGGGGGGGSW